MVSYLKSFNGKYDASNYRPHFEELVKGLLIHLDDPNTEIQEAVQGRYSYSPEKSGNFILSLWSNLIHKTLSTAINIVMLPS